MTNNMYTWGGVHSQRIVWDSYIRNPTCITQETNNNRFTIYGVYLWLLPQTSSSGFCLCLNLFYSWWQVPLFQYLLYSGCLRVHVQFPRRICTQVLLSSILVPKVPKDLCLHVQFSRDICIKFDVFSW